MSELRVNAPRHARGVPREPLPPLAAGEAYEDVASAFERLNITPPAAELYLFERVGSTMDVARRLTEAAPAGPVLGLDACERPWSPSASKLVVARQQSAGRGRGGRRWCSAPGSGIYATFALAPPPAAAPPEGLSLVLGLAVLETARAWGADAALKWPNDVLAAEPCDGVHRKLAGVLVELASRGSTIEHIYAGIGLNVLSAEMPPDVPAVSLAELAVVPPDIHEVLARLTAAVLDAVGAFFASGFGKFRRAWNEASLMPGRRVGFIERGARRTGTAIGADARGGLLVRLDDPEGEVVAVYSGEVEAFSAALDAR